MLNRNTDIEAFKAFVLEWNVENPVDRWWRSKHKVAFNSSLHREISFIDEFMEFYEDMLYDKASKQNQKKKEEPYVPNSHDIFYSQPPGSNEMSEDEFNEIEI